MQEDGKYVLPIQDSSHPIGYQGAAAAHKHARIVMVVAAAGVFRMRRRIPIDAFQCICRMLPDGVAASDPGVCTVQPCPAAMNEHCLGKHMLLWQATRGPMMQLKCRVPLRS